MVISVATPDTENRTLARASIRAALQELLGAYWNQPVTSIQFSSRSGEALALLSPAQRLGMSISHAPGCSVAAVHLRHAVGIDVVRVDTNGVGTEGASFDWDQVAHDYLGPRTHERLQRIASDARASAFAQAWSQLEAGLKCLGQGLTEWTPAQGQALDRCTVMALDLPPALCGTLAIGPLPLSPDGSR